MSLTFYSSWPRNGRGDWLRVSKMDRSLTAWVQSDRVVLVDQAVEFFTNQIRFHPDDAFVFAMRGMLRDDRNEYDAAVRDFSEAVKLDPSCIFAWLHQGRARTWCSKNDFQKAMSGL